MEERDMTNLVPGYLSGEQFDQAWDSEFENYAAVFSELGLVNP